MFFWTNKVFVLLYFSLQDTNEIGDDINLFWEEFDQFHSKTGLFADRDHIWNSSDIQKGNAHLWHYRNSFRYTKLFGKLSCRVTSKILGIGSAERSWGDTKHLKTNKRSHLSGERTKKQATIFGASCMERAEIKQRFRTESKNPYKYWTDEDFDREFDMLAEIDLQKPKRVLRIFKN